PSQVQDDNLHKPTNAKLLVDGSRAAFGCAFQAYINGAALLTDEMEDTQLAAAAWPWDRRDWTSAVGSGYAEATCTAFQTFGVYRPLQTARFTAQDAIQSITAFPDAEVTNKPQLLAEANLLLGYGRILLGEGFCSAAENLGPELFPRSEEHTSELQSPFDLVCRLLLEKKKSIRSCSSVTPGNSRPTRVTTSRQSCETTRTFTLSTLVRRLRRSRASSHPIRSISSSSRR